MTCQQMIEAVQLPEGWTLDQTKIKIGRKTFAFCVDTPRQQIHFCGWLDFLRWSVKHGYHKGDELNFSNGGGQRNENLHHVYKSKRIFYAIEDGTAKVLLPVGNSWNYRKLGKDLKLRPIQGNWSKGYFYTDQSNLPKIEKIFNYSFVLESATVGYMDDIQQNGYAK